ncbi:MAG: PQQ-like beta-propeller repeat protein [Bacteroidales bacterium]|nr:PQQ-like beta-propeller repeat protein [Bacteroidales bacterium]
MKFRKNYKQQIIKLPNLKVILLISTVLSLSMCTQNSNWRGENRDGHFKEKGLLKQWPEDGPHKVLTIEGIGLGFSSAIMANNTIYVSGMFDTLDYLSAIDLQGNVKWQLPYGRSWNGSYPETYSTPTVDGSRIYVFSGSGELVCIDARKGIIIWKVDVDKEFESPRRNWGQAESPLIVDDIVISTPCGDMTTVVAYDKKTGELAWKSESLNTDPSWTSPILYEYKDLRFILAMTAEHLVAVDPESGVFKWVYLYIKPDLVLPHDPSNPYYDAYTSGALISVLTNTPIFKDDEIYISQGYDYPSVMLKVDPSGESVTEKWFNHTLDTHHGGFVKVSGHIYGSNWINNVNGNWVCLDWETGEVQYEETWQNKGSIIYADGMLYCYEEKRGNLALVKPNPEKFDLVSSFKVEGAGAHWSHPSIFNGNLFIRHRDELMVYDVSKKSKVRQARF